MIIAFSTIGGTDTYRLAKQIDPASNNQLKPVLIEQQCSAEEKVLALCGQQSIIDFSDYLENKLVLGVFSFYLCCKQIYRWIIYINENRVCTKSGISVKCG